MQPAVIKGICFHKMLSEKINTGREPTTRL